MEVLSSHVVFEIIVSVLRSSVGLGNSTRTSRISDSWYGWVYHYGESSCVLDYSTYKRLICNLYTQLL